MIAKLFNMRLTKMSKMYCMCSLFDTKSLVSIHGDFIEEIKVNLHLLPMVVRSMSL